MDERGEGMAPSSRGGKGKTVRAGKLGTRLLSDTLHTRRSIESLTSREQHPQLKYKHYKVKELTRDVSYRLDDSTL